MMNQDERHAMELAADQIIQLRQQNAVLSAQMHVVEIFGRIAPAPREGYGAEEDSVWLLRKCLDRHEEPTKCDLDVTREPQPPIAGNW